MFSASSPFSVLREGYQDAARSTPSRPASRVDASSSSSDEDQTQPAAARYRASLVQGTAGRLQDSVLLQQFEAAAGAEGPTMDPLKPPPTFLPRPPPVGQPQATFQPPTSLRPFGAQQLAPVSQPSSPFASAALQALPVDAARFSQQQHNPLYGGQRAAAPRNSATPTEAKPKRLDLENAGSTGVPRTLQSSESSISPEAQLQLRGQQRERPLMTSLLPTPPPERTSSWPQQQPLAPLPPAVNDKPRTHSEAATHHATAAGWQQQPAAGWDHSAEAAAAYEQHSPAQQQQQQPYYGEQGQQQAYGEEQQPPYYQQEQQAYAKGQAVGEWEGHDAEGFQGEHAAAYPYQEQQQWEAQQHQQQWQYGEGGPDWQQQGGEYQAGEGGVPQQYGEAGEQYQTYCGADPEQHYAAAEGQQQWQPDAGPEQHYSGAEGQQQWQGERGYVGEPEQPADAAHPEQQQQHAGSDVQQHAGAEAGDELGSAGQGQAEAQESWAAPTQAPPAAFPPGPPASFVRPPGRLPPPPSVWAPPGMQPRKLPPPPGSKESPIKAFYAKGLPPGGASHAPLPVGLPKPASHQPAGAAAVQPPGWPSRIPRLSWPPGPAAAANGSSVASAPAPQQSEEGSVEQPQEAAPLLQQPPAAQRALGFGGALEAAELGAEEGESRIPRPPAMAFGAPPGLPALGMPTTAFQPGAVSASATPTGVEPAVPASQQPPGVVPDSGYPAAFHPATAGLLRRSSRQSEARAPPMLGMSGAPLYKTFSGGSEAGQAAGGAPPSFMLRPPPLGSQQVPGGWNQPKPLVPMAPAGSAGAVATSPKPGGGPPPAIFRPQPPTPPASAAAAGAAFGGRRRGGKRRRSLCGLLPLLLVGLVVGAFVSAGAVVAGVTAAANLAHAGIATLSHFSWAYNPHAAGVQPPRQPWEVGLAHLGGQPAHPSTLPWLLAAWQPARQQLDGYMSQTSGAVWERTQQAVSCDRQEPWCTVKQWAYHSAMLAATICRDSVPQALRLVKTVPQWAPALWAHVGPPTLALAHEQGSQLREHLLLLRTPEGQQQWRALLGERASEARQLAVLLLRWGQCTYKDVTDNLLHTGIKTASLSSLTQPASACWWDHMGPYLVKAAVQQEQEQQVVPAAAEDDKQPAAAAPTPAPSNATEAAAPLNATEAVPPPDSPAAAQQEKQPAAQQEKQPAAAEGKEKEREEEGVQEAPPLPASQLEEDAGTPAAADGAREVPPLPSPPFAEEGLEEGAAGSMAREGMDEDEYDRMLEEQLLREAEEHEAAALAADEAAGGPAEEEVEDGEGQPEPEGSTAGEEAAGEPPPPEQLGTIEQQALPEEEEGSAAGEAQAAGGDSPAADEAVAAAAEPGAPQQAEAAPEQPPAEPAASDDLPEQEQQPAAPAGSQPPELEQEQPPAEQPEQAVEEAAAEEPSSKEPEQPAAEEAAPDLAQPAGVQAEEPPTEQAATLESVPPPEEAAAADQSAPEQPEQPPAEQETAASEAAESPLPPAEQLAQEEQARSAAEVAPTLPEEQEESAPAPLLPPEQQLPQQQQEEEKAAAPEETDEASPSPPAAAEPLPAEKAAAPAEPLPAEVPAAEQPATPPLLARLHEAVVPRLQAAQQLVRDNQLALAVTAAVVLATGLGVAVGSVLGARSAAAARAAIALAAAQAPPPPKPSSRSGRRARVQVEEAPPKEEEEEQSESDSGETGRSGSMLGSLLRSARKIRAPNPDNEVDQEVDAPGPSQRRRGRKSAPAALAPILEDGAAAGTASKRRQAARTPAARRPPAVDAQASEGEEEGAPTRSAHVAGGSRSTAPGGRRVLAAAVEEEQLPDWGKCGQSWMQGVCDLTCGRCSGASVPNATAPPPPATSAALAGTLSSSRAEYAKVLGLSYLFYYAQRSGKLPANNPVAWRGDSHMNDTVPGGFHDAGDHLKLNFPLATSVSFLAWGLLDFPSGYARAGQAGAAADNLRWAADYLMGCHTGDNQYVGQIGDPGVDHSYWGRPEDQTGARPAYVWDSSKPASDLAGAAASALASTSLALRGTDAAYADRCLQHARGLFDFASKFEGKYSDAYPSATYVYMSANYLDDLAHAAAWLYRATKEQAYLTAAQSYLQRAQYQRNYFVNWDSVFAAADLLLLGQGVGPSPGVDLTYQFSTFLRSWQQGQNGIKFSPKGLAVAPLGGWGNLRHAANAAFLSVLNAKRTTDPAERAACLAFAGTQAAYMLGLAGSDRSYLVGYGNNPPTHVHHRAASCPPPPAACTYETAFNAPGPNPHILAGALVGGPSDSDAYTDARSDFQSNEVAYDYNAGFTGLLAGLVELLP